MQLTELYLDRQLYRARQTIETQGADYVSSNVAQPPSNAIASGNSVTDINTNAEQLNGASIAPGTIPAATLDLGNWGWTQTCAFSMTDADTVSWGPGTFTSANGSTVLAIGASNTGNMAATTYVYLDINVSLTAYQISTSVTAAVGLGKVLIAVCSPGAATATYALVQATQIVGDNIIANTINASKITTGQLIVGTNVGLGTAQDTAGVTTIVGNVVTTGFVNALSVVAGSVSANNVTAGTITGSTVRTASSGQRVQMSASTNTLDIYDASRLRMQLGGQGTTFYDTSSNNVADIYAGTTGGLLITTANSGSSSRSIFVNAGTGGVASLGIGSTNYIYANGSTAEVYTAKSIQPVGGGLDLGGNPSSFGTGYFANLEANTSIYLGAEINPASDWGWGYVTGSSGALSRTNTSWSVNRDATGTYTVSIGFTSSVYNVQVTPYAASGGGAPGAKVSNLNTTNFTVITYNDAGTLADFNFFFLVLN